jgi:hypothetical protein
MSRIRNSLQLAGAIAAVVFVAGLSIGSTRSMPPNAVVFIDPTSKKYFAPTCISDASRLRAATADDAHQLGYQPDPECRDNGSFVQEDRSLSGFALQRLGVLRPIANRWNDDGSWNW